MKLSLPNLCKNIFNLADWSESLILKWSGKLSLPVDTYKGIAEKKQLVGLKPSV